MQKDNIKVEGHRGTWHIIDRGIWRGETIFLLEHEAYGDDAACIIVNETYKVLLDDVHNGFLDLEESQYDSADKVTRLD